MTDNTYKYKSNEIDDNIDIRSVNHNIIILILKN